jgi:Rod binding domain-containing protein
MDEIESIGMPRSLPLTEVPDRMPYRVSLRSPQGTQAGGEVQAGDSEAISLRLYDRQEQQIAKDFESVLLTKVFEQVQASIQDGGFDEEDGGGQQVRGLFWFYLAQDVGDKGGFGLWKDIYQQIKQMRGAGDPAGSVDEEL